MQNRVWKIARVFIDNLLTYIYISRNYRRTVSVENFTRISLASLSSEYIYIYISYKVSQKERMKITE